MKTDIAVLFARDPLSLTRDDIKNTIKELRAMRAAAPLPTAVKPKKTKPSIDVEFTL